MGIIFKNNVMYGNNINQIYNGMNIDYSTILYSNTTTSFQSPLTYTANKDCIVYVAYNGSNSTNMRILINNQQATPDTLSNRLSYTLILDKNDTIQSRYDAGNAETCYCTMRIYPIIYPTKDILPIIYSEDEREIGVWTDGKPLYQKTFNTTSSSSTSTAAVLADTGENTEIIKFYGIINGSRNIISLLDENQWSYSWIATNKHQIANFAKGNVYISLPCIVTCLYTKTTDRPGSGQWTPQGIPTHHYSTEEHVVGTWVDGNTLYERTYIDIGYTGTTDTTIVDANIKSNSGIYNVKSITGLWSIGGFGYSNATTQAFGETGIFTGGSQILYARVTPNGLAVVRTNTNFGYRAFLTVQYTKSAS